MLKSITLRNFTLFRSARLEFASGLNVIVGENGTGKTHILKAAYCGLAANSSGINESAPDKRQLQAALAAKLSGVFRPDEMGRLVRRSVGKAKCDLDFAFDDDSMNLSFGFSRSASGEVSLQKTPAKPVRQRPVFLPTRELLTISPGFVSLYETTHLPFEETWRDTCILLGAPLARGPREARIRELLGPLETAMGGSLESDSAGRFYLNSHSGSGRMEMHLVAEGLRKLATIARLIATGALLDSGYLFWDEPEANLNPRIIKLIAQTILRIAANGIQVFVATHSLFLLRELHILKTQHRFANLDSQCFGLHLQDDGSVNVRQGATMDDVGSLAVLDEELQQSDRYMDLELQSQEQ